MLALHWQKTVRITYLLAGLIKPFNYLKKILLAFSMLTISKARYKHSELFDKMNVFFVERINLFRIKFISLMIAALCKV